MSQAMQNRMMTRRAALLLEVVVALALMIASLAVLGAQLRSGILTMRSAEELNRGVALVDRLMALMELDLELQARLFEDQQREGDFGEQFPGYFWEMELEPLEVTELEDEEVLDVDEDELPALFRMDITILYDPPDEDDPLGSIDAARDLYTVHMIRATPPQIDLTEDFGIAADQVEQLQQILPDFDPQQFNPQALITQLSLMVEEDPASLLALAPMIQQLMQQFAPEGGAGNQQGLAALQSLFGQSGGGTGAGQNGNLEAGLDQLRSLQDQLGGSGGAGGGGNRRGRTSPGESIESTPRSESSLGEPAYTIEDLMEMRESMQQGQRR
jgi:hypothetical protein